MDRWLRLSQERKISAGDFLEAALETHSAEPLHAVDEILDDLSQLLMLRYEGLPISKLDLSSTHAHDPARRTRNHYRRLFDASGVPRLDFRTWASESLALWIESALAGAIYAEGGLPHGNDPAFDVLSICHDNAGRQKLRITQVKATEKNLQAQGGDAIQKFELLENGYYDAELSARLEMIKDRKESPTEMNVGELMFDPGRLYRVTILHADDRARIDLMTQYGQKIPGDTERRSLLLVEIEWGLFWQILSGKVYGQLN
jgi:hypothetical protein